MWLSNGRRIRLPASSEAPPKEKNASHDSGDLEGPGGGQMTAQALQAPASSSTYISHARLKTRAELEALAKNDDDDEPKGPLRKNASAQARSTASLGLLPKLQGSPGGSVAPSLGSPGPRRDKGNSSRPWDRLHRPVGLPPELLSTRLSEAAPARPRLQQAPSKQPGTDHAVSSISQQVSATCATDRRGAAMAEPLSASHEEAAADELWDWEPPLRTGDKRGRRAEWQPAEAAVSKKRRKPASEAAARDRGTSQRSGGGALGGRGSPEDVRRTARRSSAAIGAPGGALSDQEGEPELHGDGGAEEEEAFESLRLHDQESGLTMEVPGYIGHHLRPYQREGVEFLFRRYARGGGGVLADDMGLGKTVQTVAFIVAVITSRAAQGLDPEPVLVVAPNSVIQNWLREFDQWTGGRIQVATVHGASKDRALKDVESGLAQVALTTYGTWSTLVGDGEGLRGRAEELGIDERVLLQMWHMVFYDEAHLLKNDKSKTYMSAGRIRTLLRYGLTGTVMSNNYHELYALMDFMVPGSLGPDDKTFREYYTAVIKHGQRRAANQQQLEKGRTRQGELTTLVHKYLLRRTKDNTIKDQLPTKVDHVVFCRMSDMQIRAYQRLLDSPDFQLVIKARDPCECGSGSKRGDCCHWSVSREEGGVLWPQQHSCDCGDEFHPFNNPKGCKRHKPDGCPPVPIYGSPCPSCVMFPALALLQKVCNHLELLKADPSRPNMTDEQLARDLEVADLAFGDDAELIGGCYADHGFESSSDPRHCGKMLVLKDLLQKWHAEGSSKVLLFSHSVRMLDILENMLKRYHYSFNRLDGSTSQQARQERVDAFNNSESCFVFLISTKAGGLGLNLTSANKVVVFDPHWNPSYDLQAQDRAFRIGQVRDVSVYRLVALGSIQELVYQRQIYKQQQSNAIIDGTMEKRFFNGVQPEKRDLSGDPGDLWGLQNLLKLTADTVKTREIMQAQQVAEAQYRVMRFEADDASVEDTPEIRALGEVFSRADEMDAAELGEAVHAILETTHRQQARLAGAGGGSTQQQQQQQQQEERGGQEDQPQEAYDGPVLSEGAGVAYTLRHSSLLGGSDVEHALARGLGVSASGSPAVAAVPRWPSAAIRSTGGGRASPAVLASAAADENLPASKVLRALAAWQGVPVSAMAERLMQCSRKERLELKASYCDACPE